MRKLKVFILITVFILGSTALVIAQINVSIPDTSAVKGNSISIPIIVSDIVPEDSIISYQFTVTFNEDVLDATGTSSSGALTESEDWSIWSNPDQDGQIIVGAFSFNTYLSGSGTLIKLNFNVVGDSEETTDLSFSSFLFNAGKPSANTRDGTFTTTENLINIIVTTNIGSGTQVLVDGAAQNAPYSTQWHANTSHTIGVESHQYGFHGVRYVFKSWSHGGEQNQSVSPGSDTIYTANLSTQYYLKVTSAHGNPRGQNWYDEGMMANFRVTNPANSSNGTRYMFICWSGDYNGTSPSGSILMNSPKEVIAKWQTQYYLKTVENPNEGGDMILTPPGGWYNSGMMVGLKAIVARDYKWGGWSGDLSGKENPTIIKMDEPKSVTANFYQITHKLIMVMDPIRSGITIPPVGVHTYPKNTIVDISAKPNREYEFVNWTGDVSNPRSRVTTVRMNSDKEVTACFSLIASIEDEETASFKYNLEKNYPNPFNPETVISYEIGKEIDGTSNVHLVIYNSLGELVRTLVNEHQAPGQYSVVWDGKDNKGNTVNTGIYIAQMIANKHVFNLKMIFVK